MSGAGSDLRLYRSPRLVVAAILVAPLAGLGGAWCLMDFYLRPERPSADASAQQVVDFLVHPQGIQRLPGEEQIQLIRGFVERAAAHAPFAEELAGALRRSTEEERSAFWESVIRALKPVVLQDIRSYAGLTPDQQTAYLDGRIREYQRLESVLRKLVANTSSARQALLEPAAALRLILQNTTDEERHAGKQYLQAVATRAAAIRNDPDLLARFETHAAGAPAAPSDTATP